MGQIITVDFRNDTIYAFEDAFGNVQVAIRPICEAVGLNWSGQFLRIKRDSVLSKAVCIMQTPFSHDGGQEMVCLPLERLNGWLFTIDDSRIKDETTRAKVIAYKEECYQVLYNHFYAKAEQKEKPEMPEFDERAIDIGTKLRMISESRLSFGCPSSRALWFKLGLTQVPEMLLVPEQLELPFRTIENNLDEEVA